MMRHHDFPQHVADVMRVSMNGVFVADVRDAVRSGEMALVSHGAAFALLTQKGDSVCIEAVEGDGGTELTKILVSGAAAAGLSCEAWVFNAARARLAARAGMKPTGLTRTGANGISQLQVRA